LQTRNLHATALIDAAIELDEERRRTQYALDQHLPDANKVAAETGKLFREGKKEEANASREKSAALKEQTQQLETELRQKETALHEILCQLPNSPNPLVPTGKSSTDNETVREWGVAISMENALP